MKFEPIYCKNLVQNNGSNGYAEGKINVINENGYAGIVTLWTKPGFVLEKLKNQFPEFLQPGSPIVALTSLYGNGLPQMLANLANNPQITHIAVIGKDTPSIPSFTYLSNFLNLGVESYSNSSSFNRIVGTAFPLDKQFTPSDFAHIKLQRFDENNLESLGKFLEQLHSSPSSRKVITLSQPVFTDYPSDSAAHTIQAETPLKAWMEILHRLNRFGQNKEIDKGTRRSLYYLKAIIQNAQPEDPALLASMGFKTEELLAYRHIILNPELKDPTTYTYGNRLRQYYGIDALLEVAKKFKVDPMDNRGFISTWDTERDTAAALNLSVPCLTNLYFFNENGQITLSADFRTHSAVSAWLTNTYGLRAIQELVCKEAGMPPGRLIVNSRWIAIDPNDAKTKAALETVQKQRTTPIQVNDPQGYFVCNTNGDTIVLEHFTSTGTKLGEYTGKTAESIKNMLRRDSAVSNPDHAVWIGMELMKAELSTNTKI